MPSSTVGVSLRQVAQQSQIISKFLWTSTAPNFFPGERFNLLQNVQTGSGAHPSLECEEINLHPPV